MAFRGVKNRKFKKKEKENNNKRFLNKRVKRTKTRKKIDSSHLAKVIISNIIVLLMVLSRQQDRHNVVRDTPSLESNQLIMRSDY